MLEVTKAEHVHRMLSAPSRPLIGRHPVLNIYSKILISKTPRGFFHIEEKRHDWAAQNGADRPLSLGGLVFKTLRGRFLSARNSRHEHPLCILAVLRDHGDSSPCRLCRHSRK